MRTFTSFDEVTAAAGEELGSSDWITVDQDRVDQFAEATGDHQWIHVDTERAAEGPFGGSFPAPIDVQTSPPNPNGVPPTPGIPIAGRPGLRRR